MKIFYKNNGAVTIFLILILVPVLALSGIFVEISRVELAKPLITSSADLALNTALTNYDSKLKDYYGLMGSAQNTSDTLDVAQEYFKNCINSQIVDEDYLDQCWEKVSTVVNNGAKLIGRDSIITTEAETISNLLLLEIPELTVKGVDNANLSNPVFLKSQIVEFMKYRAPVEIVTGLFEELKGQADYLKNLKKDEQLQKKEQVTYEAENELLQRLYDIYTEVNEYNNLGITADYLSGIATTMDSLRNQYSTFHNHAVRRYINITSDNAKSFYEDNSFDLGDVESASVTSWTKAEIEKYLYRGGSGWEKDGILTRIEEFETAYKELDQGLAPIYDLLNEKGANAIDELQFCFQMYEDKKIVGWIQKYGIARSNLNAKSAIISDMYDAAQNDPDGLKAELEAETVTIDDEKIAAKFDITNKYELNEYELLEKIYEYYQNFRNENIEFKGKGKAAYIMGIWNKVKTDKDEIYRKELNGVFSGELNGVFSDIDDKQTLLDIQKTLGKYVENINDAKDHIENIKKLISGKTDENGLYQLAQKYSISLNDWRASANYESTEGSYCAASKARADEKITQQMISEAQIDEFLERINGIDSFLSGVKKNIMEETKYGKTPIYSITNLSDLVGASGMEAKDIKGNITQDELNTLARDTFSFTKGTTSLVPAENNHPDLEKSKTDLYQYMQDHFKDAETTKNDAKGKEKYNQYKNASEKNGSMGDDKTGETDAISEITGLTAADYPSRFENKADSVGLLDAILNLVTDLSKDATGTLKNARDTLYVTEYCMNMFSYASYENEMKYDYMKTHDIQLNSLAGLSTKISSGDLINTLVNQSTVKDTINQLAQNEDTTVTANKTLTNKPINDTNNYAYEREIEYILFGKENAENIKSIKQQLFKVRYTMNLIPGYMLFWNDKVIKGISAGVSSATSGIIPEPLVRVVMILALVGIESNNDVKLLLEGVPVKLLKTGNNATEAEWVYSVDNFFSGDMSTYGVTSGSNPEQNQKVDAFRMQYSDYLTLLLYFQLSSSDDTKVNAVYKRIGDVIQSNMAEKVYKDSSDKFKLSNCITQFSLNYSAVVKPLVFNLGIYNGYGVEALLSDKKWRTIQGNMVRGY